MDFREEKLEDILVGKSEGKRTFGKHNFGGENGF